MIKETLKKFIPFFLLSWYHFLLAFLGAIFYGFPSRKLTVIGVIGTNGKSTVVNLAGKILEEADFKVGWISSLSLKIGEKEWLNPCHMTMPGRFFIQNFLRKMVKEGCQYAVLEVTSEGIKQHRQRFIDFDIAVFTNLAPEHIEAHGSFENYRAAKGKLFQATKGIHIVNLDNENSEYFLKFPANKKFGYTLKQLTINNQPRTRTPKESKLPTGQASSERGRQLTIIKAGKVNLKPDGIEFPVDNTKFSLFLLGSFNLYNALAAICVGLSQKISLETCRKALEKVENIPGRMEFIKEGQDFRIIVDLAHTPNSFEEVFKTVRNFPHNKIISVFGSAGGGRDKWKRPELGKIAAKYSNYIILTNEDPYDEDPIEIIEQVAKGAFEEIRVNPRSYPRKSASIHKILDRREAIRKALKLAKSNDIVLILGKGAEQTMIIGAKKIPWDDRKIAKEELEKLSLN